MMNRSDETLVVDVIIDGDPMSKSRPRFGKRGTVYTPRKTKEAERYLGIFIKQASPGITPNQKDSFAVDIRFYCKSYHRRDIDNMVKLVFDACNELVWQDDVQVERLAAEVVRGASDHPRTEIRIYTFPSSVPYQPCQVCGKPIRLHPSWGNRKFCSRKCSAISQTRRTEIPCAHCENTLNYTASELKRKGAKYCNQECKRLATTIQLKCDQCHSVYYKPQSQVRKNTRRFCSEVCMKVFFRQQRKVRAYGTCSDCGNATSKKTYQRCRACAVGTFRNNKAA